MAVFRVCLQAAIENSAQRRHRTSHTCLHASVCIQWHIFQHHLNDLLLLVLRGHCHGLLARSSQTLRLVDSGDVRIDGTSVRDLSTHFICQKVAVVPQDIHLFSGIIRENIELGLQKALSPEELAKVVSKSRLEDVVESLPDGLDTDTGAHGSALSVGQRQRVAIARALARRPAVLVLDEPTSALDPENEALLCEAIQDIRGEAAVFIITHKLAVARNADCINVRHRGTVIETGSHEELIALRGTYWNIFSPLNNS